MVRVPSDSVRTHSCDSVYLRSAGMLMRMLQLSLRVGRAWLFQQAIEGCLKRRQNLAVAHERQFYHACRQLFVADDDVHFIARFHARRHPGERDGFLHRWRESAARDLALAVGCDDFLVSTKHATGAAVFLLQNQAYKARLRSIRFQRGTSDECAIRVGEVDGPREAGVER